nr:integrase, catalytic region, zinc finger, CCHC-type, peptidase aspartic, catalytic [Tanacetum cinerariifolium]
KVKECDCLAQKLSKQTESVSKKDHTKLLQRFAKVEKHSISLELALQKCKEQGKGKYVDTTFDRPSAVRQPNAQRVLKPLVLGKPTPFSRNKKSILKNTNVLAPEMSNSTTSVSRPQLKSNPIGDRVMRNSSQGKKQEVEDQRRSVKLSKNKMSITACNDSLNARTLNVNYVSSMCENCVLIDKHDMCVLNSIAKSIKRTVASESNQKPRNITRKLYERVSKTCSWCKTCSWWYSKFTPSEYKWKPKSGKENVNPNIVEIVLFIFDSGCSKHMTGNLKLLINFVEKFLGKVKFGNDQIVPILGYVDLVYGAVTIKRVYYVEGLNHNLFFVGQFCDADLEVAFRNSTCYICDLKVNDLLTGKVKFGNDQIVPILGYVDLVYGAVTIKRVYYVEGLNHNLFFVGQFCDADLEVAFRNSTCYICDLKVNDLLTGSRGMDLYSITLQDTNCPNPICLIAKETSSQAWLWHRRLSHLKFDTINLLSKNDIVVGLPKLKFVKDHLCSSCEWGKANRKGLQAQVRVVRTDKGTEFLNKNLHAYFAAKGILHQTSVARTPEQNGVVKRRNRTLVEAARTMLNAAKVPLFFWADAIATACFTQNHGENLDKIKEKGHECIFVGYSTQSRAYRVFNKRTRVIMESIHVNFDELPLMASDQISSNPAPECQTMVLEHVSLSPVIQCQANVPQADRTVTTSNELDLLFSPMFDDLLNGSSKVVSKSSAVSTADAPNQRQNYIIPLNIHTTPAPTCQVPYLAPIVSSFENISQAETYAKNDQVANDEFINIFCTPVQDQGETSSRHVDSSNM